MLAHQNGTLKFAKEIQVLQIVMILPVEFWLESCSSRQGFRVYQKHPLLGLMERLKVFKWMFGWLILTNVTDYTDQILLLTPRCMKSFSCSPAPLQKYRIAGYVTSLTNSSIVVDLGVEHGLEMGTQLVIFRREADLLSSGDSEVPKEN